MSGLTKARVIVAGAGALGSCIAVRLARGGARVTLVDPGSPSANASGIAAGMLAPAFESVLDPDAGASFDLLRSARDLWPGLARGLGDIGLRRTGALWLDLPEAAPRAHALAQGLERLGARVRAAAPPTGASEALFTPEDWRLDPSATLAALRRAFDDAGGRCIGVGLRTFEPGVATLSDGARLEADLLVAATGAEAAGLAPELACLVPIKGQILKYPTLRPPADAQCLRCADGYATGGGDGLSVGATMQMGARDLAVDPAVTARLHALAGRLHPATAAIVPVARVGVRAASPDGPPIIGASARSGVWVAAGARRNGWLLAPLAAEIIAAELEGRDPGPYAAALRPRGTVD